MRPKRAAFCVFPKLHKSTVDIRNSLHAGRGEDLIRNPGPCLESATVFGGDMLKEVVAYMAAHGIREA